MGSIKKIERARRFKIKAIIALLALFLLNAIGSISAQEKESLGDLNLPSVEKEEWCFKKFPIMAWWGPSGENTLNDFKRYRDAGFNIYPANPDSGFESALKLARRAGLPVMPWRTMQGFNLPKPESPIIFPENDRNIVGWITHDEPGGYKRVTEAITAVNEQMQKNPKKWTLFNFFPPDNQNSPNTEEIAEAAIRNGMPVLSYDNYIEVKDGNDPIDKHFKNVSRVRALSLKYNVPFWAFALTTKHWYFRRPSESDVRWKQYTNLAYGAKGLWYFCYWGPPDWQDRDWEPRSIVNSSTGEPTDLYDVVKAINEAVLDVGDILLGLTSENVVHTHAPEGQKQFIKDRYWISDIEAQNALIGFFHDKKGQKYAMLVNGLHGKDKSSKETTDEIELTFGSNIKSVEAISWLDGKKGKILLKDQKTKLTVVGGTGDC